MSKRRSPIWNYFSAGESDRFAKVPRGGQSTKAFTIISLAIWGPNTQWSTRSTKRRRPWRSGTARGADTNHTTLKQQLTLQESDDRSRVWTTSNPRALCISTKIGEVIALDCQLFFLVEDIGFIRLINVLESRYRIPSRKYITETILPKIHSDIKSKVKDEIAEVKWLSCTSDIWRTEVSNGSLISLTAHWLTDCFKKKAAMLHAQSIPGSHTGEVISGKYQKMLAEWNIQKWHLHCFVVNNASNMKKAMADGGYNCHGCFAHTLQLVIHDGVLSQQYVQRILVTCRSLVGSGHRWLAYSKLNKIQATLGIPQHRLKQDVATRWNSTLFMSSNRKRH